MSPELIVASFGLAFSLANLLSTIFLSNAVFRLLMTDKNEKNSPVAPPDEKGLVDLREVPTYDMRFRG